MKLQVAKPETPQDMTFLNSFEMVGGSQFSAGNPEIPNLDTIHF